MTVLGSVRKRSFRWSAAFTQNRVETGAEKPQELAGLRVTSFLSLPDLVAVTFCAVTFCAVEYNRQREVTKTTDQAGTIHAFDYDKLGGQTQDRVIDLGIGVDGAVRRIATTYEVRGMRETITSYDNATVGQGNVVNEVQFAYNNFALRQNAVGFGFRAIF